LEKHLGYFKDRYCQYFDTEEEPGKDGNGQQNPENNSRNRRSRLSSLALVARADSQTSPATTLVKLQRANSLNLNAANQHLLQRIGELFGSSATGSFDPANLIQIM